MWEMESWGCGVEGAGWDARQALSRAGKLAWLREASWTAVASGAEVSFITFPSRVTWAKSSPDCLAFSSPLPGWASPRVWSVARSSAVVFAAEAPPVFFSSVKEAGIRFRLTPAVPSASGGMYVPGPDVLVSPCGVEGLTSPRTLCNVPLPGAGASRRIDCTQACSSSRHSETEFCPGLAKAKDFVSTVIKSPSRRDGESSPLAAPSSLPAAAPESPSRPSCLTAASYKKSKRSGVSLSSAMCSA